MFLRHKSMNFTQPLQEHVSLTKRALEFQRAPGPGGGGGGGALYSSPAHLKTNWLLDIGFYSRRVAGAALFV